jgi:hypothetical protein
MKDISHLFLNPANPDNLCLYPLLLKLNHYPEIFDLSPAVQ